VPGYHFFREAVLGFDFPLMEAWVQNGAGGLNNPDPRHVIIGSGADGPG